MLHMKSFSRVAMQSAPIPLTEQERQDWESQSVAPAHFRYDFSRSVSDEFNANAILAFADAFMPAVHTYMLPPFKPLFQNRAYIVDAICEQLKCTRKSYKDRLKAQSADSAKKKKKRIKARQMSVSREQTLFDAALTEFRNESAHEGQTCGLHGIRWNDCSP